MARKRMFSLLVVDTDEFLDMPSSTQSLYYHLGMRADDDGFVSSPKRIVKLVNCSDDDLKLLIAKGFIIPFDSGIIAIKHWKLNNDLKKDRYTPTIYLNEKSTLRVNKNRVYSIVGNNLETKWIQNGNKLDTQYSKDKNSIDKYSIDKSSIELGKYRDSIEKVEDRENIDNRGYGGKKERERKEPNETSCPQYSSPSYPQSQQLTANDIVDLFNDICTTYPTVDGITQYSTALSNSLMFDRYSKADYSTIFQKAEQSSNLKARTHDEESPVDFGWILEHSKEIKDGAFDN